jgi:CheY-like chemotaxis protein
MGETTHAVDTEPAQIADQDLVRRTHGHTILGLIHDPIAQDLLMEIAVERGYGLFCATGAEEGARMLSEDPPQLLVIDVDGGDGRALLSIARAHPRWKLIPVLAITATNNSMIAVSLDAPVFFKPELAGFERAVTGRFESNEMDEEEETLPWFGRSPSA